MNGSIDALAMVLLQAAGGPAFILDADGQVLAANDVACRLFVAAQAHPAEGVCLPTLPEPLARLLARRHRAEEDQGAGNGLGPFVFEESFDDSVFSFTVYPVESAAGGLARHVVISQDVTEARRTAEELRRERQRFFFVLESMPGSILLVDAELVIRYANRQSRKIFGCRVGRRCPEILPCSGPACNSCPAMHSIHEAAPVEWEATHHAHFFHLISTPMTDVDGQPVAMVMALDITPRKLVEMRLSRSEQQLKNLVDNLSEAMVILVGNRIAYTNPQMARLLGHLPDIMQGRNFMHFVHPDDRDDFARRQNSLQPLDEGPQAGFRLRTSDDSVKWVQESCTHIEWEGEPASVCLLSDVTARKAAEEAVRHLIADQEQIIARRTARLEQANQALLEEVERHKSTARKLERARRKAVESTKAKSQFLANMSHEMRTPLNVILGMTQIALREAEDNPLQRPLKMIDDAGRSLLNVINDLLDLSKIDARKILLEHVEFDLVELLQGCFRMHSVQARTKKLTLSLKIDPATPHLVRGDPARLKQVLNNLLSNALKFTSEGSIVIKAEPCPECPKNDPRLLPGRVMLCFSVSDTGPGIPADKLKTVFKSFQQADPSITRRFGGTGLGLSISRQLVRLMGGSLRVKSKEGVGSTFTCSVQLEPLSADEAAAAIQASCPRLEADTAAPARDLRILLAEDSDMNAEMITHLLDGAGHRLTRAHNGQEALDLLRREPFDLVLMDIQMPLMDGITATRLLREAEDIPWGHEIPVIAMTAYTLKGDRQRIINAGATDYVPKPIDIDLLLHKIDTLAAERGLGAPCCKPCDAEPGAVAEAQAPLTGDAADRESGGSEDSSWQAQRAKALQALAGKQRLLDKMSLAFLQETPGDRQGLAQALEREDWGAALILAHKLKGNAAAVGAGEASATALALETLLRQGLGQENGLPPGAGGGHGGPQTLDKGQRAQAMEQWSALEAALDKALARLQAETPQPGEGG